MKNSTIGFSGNLWYCWGNSKSKKYKILGYIDSKNRRVKDFNYLGNDNIAIKNYKEKTNFNSRIRYKSFI